MTSKQREDYHGTKSVFDRAVSQFEGSDEGSFISAATFQGPRDGYYYSMGPRGAGYYPDSHHKGQSPSAVETVPIDELEPSHQRPFRPAATGEELLQEAEEAAGEPILQVVNAKGLKKLVANLERKFTHNVEQRAKYADEPQRFLESEIDLDEAVKSMTSIATSPELYPDLVSAGAIPTILSVLHHDNGDIAACAIELLAELTDADAVEDSQEEAGVLVDSLLSNGLLEALVHRLAALNEDNPEEATAVYNALSVIENCVELRGFEVAKQAAAVPGLLEWVLSRLRPKSEVDANKQYTAEVMAVILQAGGQGARKRFVELGGVDRALQAVAVYRMRDPSSAEEVEFVENVSDALCALLMDPDAKDAFVEAEGVELMVLIVKGRTNARTAALKCLDFATTRCPAACDRAVDQGALRTVFGLFMGKIKSKGARKRDEATIAEEEERSLSVVGNLMSGVSTASRRNRVAAKFVENEFEKCDRLMEIFFKYDARVTGEEVRLAQEEGEEEGGIDEEEVLLARLDAGLYTLQQCALVAAQVWAVGDVGARRRILALLHQRGRTLAALREVLLEYRTTVAGESGDAKSEEERIDQVLQVTQLLEALGHRDPIRDEGKEDAVREKRHREEEENGVEDQQQQQQQVSGDDKRQKVQTLNNERASSIYK